MKRIARVNPNAALGSADCADLRRCSAFQPFGMGQRDTKRIALAARSICANLLNLRTTISTFGFTRKLSPYGLPRLGAGNESEMDPAVGSRLAVRIAAALVAAFLLAMASAIAAEPIEIPGIHNAFRASGKVISGSQPEGDAAFAALAHFGVKTIVSVDGARPDVAAARKHGLRTIHLPIGYDGVSASRQRELASVVGRAGEGLVFVHCHHGKHRGPAAVAIICEATAGWSPNEAVAWLKQAGTAEAYAGLYRSVREYQPATPEQLAKAGPFLEVAATPVLVDSMVHMDERHAALESAQKSGWKYPRASDATLLWEHLRELARTEDTAGRSADYRAKLSDSEKAASALCTALQVPAPDAAVADAALKALTQTCAACHKAYRNGKP